MQKQPFDVTKIQLVSNDNEAWVCDIHTGICGPVSTTQETTEPIQVDFLKQLKTDKQTESEDKE